MIMVDNQGDLSGSHSLAAFTESAWVGLSSADCVFPSFLFLMGVSLGLALQGKAQKLSRDRHSAWYSCPGCWGCCDRARCWQDAPERSDDASRSALSWLREQWQYAWWLGELPWRWLFPDLWGGVLARALRMVVVGILLNVWDDARHPIVLGVLQRLGLCYASLASALMGAGGSMFGPRALSAVCALLYCALFFWADIPGCGAGSLSPTCNGGRWLDRAVLGAAGTSPSGGTIAEGLGSTLMAIVTTHVGLEFGALLRATKDNHLRLVVTWALVAFATAGVGSILAVYVPVIKKLWTPSFALIVAGIAGADLIAWYLLADYVGPILLRALPSSVPTAPDDDAAAAEYDDFYLLDDDPAHLPHDDSERASSNYSVQSKSARSARSARSSRHSKRAPPPRAPHPPAHADAGLPAAASPLHADDSPSDGVGGYGYGDGSGSGSGAGAAAAAGAGTGAPSRGIEQLPCREVLGTAASAVVAPLEWLGRNAAVVFVGMVALEILLMVSIQVGSQSAWAALFEDTAARWNPSRASASSVFAAYHLALWVLVTGLLHWRRIYITF
jgi:predicted acyltransferase